MTKSDVDKLKAKLARQAGTFYKLMGEHGKETDTVQMVQTMQALYRAGVDLQTVEAILEEAQEGALI